jgi:hypothetical protein
LRNIPRRGEKEFDSTHANSRYSQLIATGEIRFREEHLLNAHDSWLHIMKEKRQSEQSLDWRKWDSRRSSWSDRDRKLPALHIDEPEKQIYRKGRYNLWKWPSSESNWGGALIIQVMG